MYRTMIRRPGTAPELRSRLAAAGRSRLPEIAFGAIELKGQELEAVTGGAGFGLGAREPVPSFDTPLAGEPATL